MDDVEIAFVTVPTARGPVTLMGRFETFADERPLILAIPGALQDPHALVGLIAQTPQADVAIALLPGMFSPLLDETSVAAFASAFDEVIAARFSGRDILRCGFSVGGLVAMAMRAGQAFVAVDSPLTTDGLWPLIEPLRKVMAQGEPDRVPGWVWAVLGIGPDRIENRDYRPLLANLNVPGIYVIAGQPLEPPRNLPRPPGAMTPEDRDLVSATPGVTPLVAAGSGHGVLVEAPRAVMLAIERGLALLGPRPT